MLEKILGYKIYILIGAVFLVAQLFFYGWAHSRGENDANMACANNTVKAEKSDAKTYQDTLNQPSPAIDAELRHDWLRK